MTELIGGKLVEQITKQKKEINLKGAGFILPFFYKFFNRIKYLILLVNNVRPHRQDKHKQNFFS